MPSKPKKPCGRPGCRELTTERFCDEHAKAYDRQRGTSAERGYGSEWRKARARYLRMNPLCRMCQTEGQITAATVVDHIVPHKGDRVLFWDRLNWQPLCKAHHDAKTAREDGGFGR